MTRTYSPAALELMAAGVTLRQIANHLDVTPAAVSLWLRGARQPDKHLADTIAYLTNRNIAERVIELIPDLEEATP